MSTRLFPIRRGCCSLAPPVPQCSGPLSPYSIAPPSSLALSRAAVPHVSCARQQIPAILQPRYVFVPSNRETASPPPCAGCNTAVSLAGIASNRRQRSVGDRSYRSAGILGPLALPVLGLRRFDCVPAFCGTGCRGCVQGKLGSGAHRNCWLQ
jgi:hypothetical protein